MRDLGAVLRKQKPEASDTGEGSEEMEIVILDPWSFNI